MLKNFGACHGYYGSIIKPVESKNGVYLAILETHKRIQSMFETKLIYKLGYKKEGS